MAELAYDIEQLWIEGKNPVEIAGELDCHIDLVYGWMAAESLDSEEDYSEEDYDIPIHTD
jgi:hypothetical protein